MPQPLGYNAKGEHYTMRKNSKRYKMDIEVQHPPDQEDDIFENSITRFKKTAVDQQML